jgi:hypothetical protein
MSPSTSAAGNQTDATVRQAGAEIYAELRSFPDAELPRQIKGGVVDVVIEGLARHAGVATRNDPVVLPLPMSRGEH